MDHNTLQEARSISAWLNDIFFRIHRHPELERQEYQTQALILAELERMGIEASPIADTGVLGIIRGGKPGKTIAFRADMDALPIQEQTGLPYRSEIPGVMHACGHDTHVTMLLGAAKLLADRKEELQGNVKLFFQPAEEGAGGAKRMIEAGCMENPHVDAVFFGHCAADHPTGSVSIRPGFVSAASNPFTVTFRGKGAHGASPHKGNDVIVAASHAVIALQTVASRRTAPTDSVVISVGSLHAGTAGNVLPETASLQGIIRTLDPNTRIRVTKDVRQIIEGIAAAMDVEAEIKIVEGYAPTCNDESMTELVKHAAAALFGDSSVYHQPAPSLGTEDVGYFLQEAPGCYYHIGVGSKEKGFVYPVHNPRFAADPDALPCGAALYVQIAEEFLQ